MQKHNFTKTLHAHLRLIHMIVIISKAKPIRKHQEFLVMDSTKLVTPNASETMRYPTKLKLHSFRIISICCNYKTNKISANTKHKQIVDLRLTGGTRGLIWRSNIYSNAFRVLLWGAGTTPYSVATRCGHATVVWPLIHKTHIEIQRIKL